MCLNVKILMGERRLAGIRFNDRLRHGRDREADFFGTSKERAMNDDCVPTIRTKSVFRHKKMLFQLNIGIFGSLPSMTAVAPRVVRDEIRVDLEIGSFS